MAGDHRLQEVADPWDGGGKIVNKATVVKSSDCELGVDGEGTEVTENLETGRVGLVRFQEEP